MYLLWVVHIAACVVVPTLLPLPREVSKRKYSHTLFSRVVNMDTYNNHPSVKREKTDKWEVISNLKLTFTGVLPFMSGNCIKPGKSNQYRGYWYHRFLGLQFNSSGYASEKDNWFRRGGISTTCVLPVGWSVNSANSSLRFLNQIHHYMG